MDENWSWIKFTAIGTSIPNNLQAAAISKLNFILRAHELQSDSSKRSIIRGICYLCDYEDQLMRGLCMEESAIRGYVDPHSPLN